MTPSITGKIAKETPARLQSSTYSPERVEHYCRLVERIEREILPHEVIVNNQYTKWSEKGEFDLADIRHFLTQFSVFSHFFIVAQLLKTINAPTLEAYHASKEILMNELGVSFHNPNKKPSGQAASAQDPESAAEWEGTVDGSPFRFSAAHFEWLLRITTHLGLQFKDFGKRKQATPTPGFSAMSLPGFMDPRIPA